MPKLPEDVEHERGKVGLCTNVSKCKIVVSNNWNDSTEVKVGSSAVAVMEDFCYLEELFAKQQ